MKPHLEVDGIKKKIKLVSHVSRSYSTRSFDNVQCYAHITNK